MTELYFVFILLGIAGSAFFSATETAILTVSMPIQDKSGTRSGRIRIIEWLMARRDTVISALLIGNNLSLVVVSATATALLSQWMTHWNVETATVMVTLIILFLGEIIPKSVALTWNTQILMTVGWFIKMLCILLKPAIFILTSLPRAIVRIIGARDAGAEISRDQLRRILETGLFQERVTGEQQRVISRLMEFGNKKVVAALVPMRDVVQIDRKATIRRAAGLIHECGFSRIPVYDGQPDHIVGILHSVDLMAAGIDMSTVGDLMRAPVFVPEQQKATELLPGLWHSGQMAVVVDEYGVPSGIVTTEDLLEEVLGEIRDEYDEREAPVFRNLAEGIYLIDGAMTIGEFNLRVAQIIPAGPYDTVAGFILNHAQRIPDRGDRFYFRNIEITVLESTRRRIVRLLVRKSATEA